MAGSIDKIESSLKNISSILAAADGVIMNPQKPFESELKKQHNGLLLVQGLATGGAMGMVATSGAIGIGSSIAATMGGLGLAAVTATASGPIGWTIGGTVVLLTGGLLYRRLKRIRKAQQEKERMKNEIILKLKTMNDKLRAENERNAQEIRNLKEAVSILEELLRSMDQAA